MVKVIFGWVGGGVSIGLKEKNGGNDR